MPFKEPFVDLHLAICPSCAAESQRIFRPGTPLDRPEVLTPEHAAALVQPMLLGLDREQCLLVSLDTRHRLLAVTTVSIGTGDRTFIAPREIYRDAILLGATAIFLAHNHPSADPSPSPEDRAVTRRVAAAGRTLGIDLLDHLVVGDPDWVSLAREGVL